jgi:hypothetical protein
VRLIRAVKCKKIAELRAAQVFAYIDDYHHVELEASEKQKVFVRSSY